MAYFSSFWKQENSTPTTNDTLSGFSKSISEAAQGFPASFRLQIGLAVLALAKTCAAAPITTTVDPTSTTTSPDTTMAPESHKGIAPWQEALIGVALTLAAYFVFRIGQNVCYPHFCETRRANYTRVN